MIIGDTKTLDERDKRRSFELNRRDSKDVEIVTYDELYIRAQEMVKLDSNIMRPS